MVIPRKILYFDYFKLILMSPKGGQSLTVQDGLWSRIVGTFSLMSETLGNSHASLLPANIIRRKVENSFLCEFLQRETKFDGIFSAAFFCLIMLLD